MSGRRKLRWFVAAVVAAHFALPFDSQALAQDEERHKTETSGLGVSAGIGSQYPIVGVQGSYYLQVPRSLFRVAPYAAVGGVFSEHGDQGEWDTGMAFGVLGSWGHQHRLLVDVFYGTIAYTYLSLHGEPAVNRIEWGPGLAAGYEYMAFSGFFVRTDVGAQYIVTVPIFAPKDRIGLALTLIGLGYKFW